MHPSLYWFVCRVELDLTQILRHYHSLSKILRKIIKNKKKLYNNSHAYLKDRDGQEGRTNAAIKCMTVGNNYTVFLTCLHYTVSLMMMKKLYIIVYEIKLGKTLTDKLQSPAA
jgi:hypothetical protein